MMADDLARPYKCTVQLALPSAQYARHLRDVISVDKEISNKVVKSFSIERTLPADGEGSDDGDEMRVLRIQFEATEAKMLRVSISTTYDTINVALKCFQEFGE